MAHRHMFKGLPGARAFLPGDEVDGMGRQSETPPIGIFAAEDAPDFIHRDTGQGIAGMDDDGDAVIGDGNLRQVLLLGHQLTGRGPQVRGALGRGIDAGAGPPALDVDADLGLGMHINLRQFFGKRLHRSGAGDAQRTAGDLRFAAGRSDAEPQQKENGQRRPRQPAADRLRGTGTEIRPGGIKRHRPRSSKAPGHSRG